VDSIGCCKASAREAMLRHVGPICKLFKRTVAWSLDDGSDILMDDFKHGGGRCGRGCVVGFVLALCVHRLQDGIMINDFGKIISIFCRIEIKHLFL